MYIINVLINITMNLHVRVQQTVVEPVGAGYVFVVFVCAFIPLCS